MNFISSQLNRKIAFLQSDGQSSELKSYYQAKFELYIIYIMSYLWNKHWSELGAEHKEQVARQILKPSIGTIVSITRQLDFNKEFFGNKKLKLLSQFINDYPGFRNEKIGHGFSFEDDIDDYLKFFEDFFSIIEGSNVHNIFDSIDLIKVLKEEGGFYKGISYKSDGITYLSWVCPKNVREFEVGEVYALANNSEYFKISPFILIQNESDFFSFVSIEEKLTGRAKYNRLIKTGNSSFFINAFEKLWVSGDGTKRKSVNGTVINVFENNYRKYIDVGITSQIANFLGKNRSSVFATIWGHGGVGKTASIQRVCDMLCSQDSKIFDYIIFLSAKDRLYNIYQGKVDSIVGGISSLNDIIINLNKIIFDSLDPDPTPIISYEGKILIVIDDFETFVSTEKDRIVSFIKELDINHHKVVLTTRAAILITGEEIQTKELNEDESVLFLHQAIVNEVPSFNTGLLKKELENDAIKKSVFKITSGRPLFILQLGIYAAQKGSIGAALNAEISSSKNALNFLYDRIYDYLSSNAKNMFLAISLLVDENDLSGLIQNLRFVLNKEDKEDEFQSALNELIKLKIIVIENRDFFKVYSADIYKLMKLYYQKKGSEFDGGINSRFKMIFKVKNAPTEVALLDNADASRALADESEVENKYRYILNRDKTPYDIKLKAVLNFASYLISNKNKIDKALKVYRDYNQIFQQEPVFVESYAVCAWASTDSKAKYRAIEIIQEFLSSNPPIGFENQLELLGMLVTYKSVLVVAERDELKIANKFSEIAKPEYDKLYSAQKQRMYDIFNSQGGKLYTFVKDMDLMKLSSSCRNWVLDGLSHYVEVSIKNFKRDIGKAVCEKIINEMPQNYQLPFIIKLNKIESIGARSRRSF